MGKDKIKNFDAVEMNLGEDLEDIEVGEIEGARHGKEKRGVYCFTTMQRFLLLKPDF